MQAMAADNQTLNEWLPAAGVPFSLILGRDGRVQSFATGVYDWEHEGTALLR